MIKNSYSLRGAAIAALVLGGDLISKLMVLSYFEQGGQAFAVTPFFNLVLVFNPGISFGLFQNLGGPWILIVLTALITAGLLIWLLRDKGLGQSGSIALGLAIGGAIGNLVDRLRLGAVVDFLDFHLAGFHWPAFNVADSGISIAMILILWRSFFGSDSKSIASKNKEGDNK